MNRDLPDPLRSAMHLVAANGHDHTARAPLPRRRAGTAMPAPIPFPQPAGLAAEPLSDDQHEAHLSEAEQHEARMSRLRLEALQRSAFNAGVSKMRKDADRMAAIMFWQGAALGAALGGAIAALWPYIPAGL